MAEKIVMPKLAMSMKQGKVIEWLFAEGQHVEKGQVVLVIETEKVTYEVEAPVSGLLHIVVELNETIPIHETLAFLAENEAELERLRIESERGRLFSEMALTLSSTLNYHKVLRATIDAAFAAMAQVGQKDDSAIAMVLLFEDDERLTVAAGRNISRNDQGRKVRADQGVIGKTVKVAEREMEGATPPCSPNSLRALSKACSGWYDSMRYLLWMIGFPNYLKAIHIIHNVSKKKFGTLDSLSKKIRLQPL